MKWTHIVPVHHLRPGFGRRLRFLVNQTIDSERELIIVDSTTSEGPLELPCLEDLASVVRLKVPHESAMVDNWNLGVEKATGELVHLIPDDDWVSPSFCQMVEEMVVRVSHASLFAVGYSNVGEEFRVPSFGQNYSWVSPPEVKTRLREGNFFHPGAVVCRAEVYKQFKYRSVGFLDWDFLLRASESFQWALMPFVLHYKAASYGMNTYDKRVVEATIEEHEKRLGIRMDEARRKYL